MPVDVASALELRTNNGLSYKKIGQLQGVSAQAVHQQLAKILPDKDLITQFKEKRGDLINFAQLKALKAYLSLDDDEQKELLKKRGLVDMGIAYDKSRLEEGLSSMNLASIHADIAALRGVDK